MTSTTSTTVTAAQTRALRHADSICFDTDQIRAIRRADNSSTGFEETVTIPVALHRVDAFDGSSGPFRCFAMTMSAQYDRRAQTFVRKVWSGSMIALTWTRGDSSPITREAGIVVDHLDVSVSNNGGKLADTFRLSTFIGLDNSARMIQVGN